MNAEPSGFGRLGETELHQLYAHRLVRGSFAAPDGKTFEREYLRSGGAVAVVPIDGDEVVLVRQYRAPLDAELLEIPAGLCDVEGEPAAETAARELAEEAGYRAARMEPLVTFLNAAGITDHRTAIFLAEGLTPCETERQGAEEEHLTVERVRLADAPKLVAEGTVQDAKTIIGLLLAHARLCT